MLAKVCLLQKAWKPRICQVLLQYPSLCIYVGGSADDEAHRGGMLGSYNGIFTKGMIPVEVQLHNSKDVIQLVCIVPAPLCSMQFADDYWYLHENEATDKERRSTPQTDGVEYMQTLSPKDRELFPYHVASP